MNAQAAAVAAGWTAVCAACVWPGVWTLRRVVPVAAAPEGASAAAPPAHDRRRAADLLAAAFVMLAATAMIGHYAVTAADGSSLALMPLARLTMAGIVVGLLRWPSTTVAATVSGAVRGVVVYAALFPAVWALGHAVDAWLPGHAPQHALTDLANEAAGWRVAARWFDAVAATPLVEELLFRGLMQPAIVILLGGAERRAATIAGAVVATSLIFAILHDPGAMAPAFLLSLPLGFVAARSGSLAPAIAMHTLNNLAAVLIARA